MNRNFIDYLKGLDNIEPDKHSGSYELVRQSVTRLAKLDLTVIDVCDLEMLFHFGNLKHGKEARSRNILSSNLLKEDKQYMLNLNERIAAGSYTNYEGTSNGNCGLFSKGKLTLLKSINKQKAQNFIQILIEVSNISEDNANELFGIVEKHLSQVMRGLGIGIASQILHMLKPNVFPIFNSKGRPAYRDFFGSKIKSGDIKSYAKDAKSVYEMKQKELPNLNFRTIDVAFWEKSETAQYLEDDFRKWLPAQAKYAEHPFTNRTIENYVRVLKASCREIDDISLDEPDLFYITDAKVFLELKVKIKNSPYYDVVNSKNNGQFSTAMNLYGEFLKGHSKNITSSIPDSTSYWFVGADWSGVKMSETFTNEGYWENGYDDKYIDVVNSVKVGDKIAIKNTYRQKRNLPFENIQERYVSCMGIKAIGTVTKNHNNGKRLDVKRHYTNLTKVWYFFSYWGTIEQIKPDNWKNQALIDFAFYDIEQNIEEFQVHYWEADDVETEDDVVEIKEYYKEDFLKEVYVTLDKYEDMVGLLERKKNIILQGAPGVGKSFLAKKLAYSLMGTLDDSRVKMIQFHQSYSYEDFIRGYRPNEEGKFDLINGVFYEFCMNNAKNDLHNNYYFIIDEINRGNLSKIFGELMLLIEHDKRGEKHQMPTTYDKKSTPAFFVPENVYIIGMMNTADRSLALPDYALRRRFCFVNIEPAFDHKGFKRDFNYYEKQDVIDTMNALNTFIGEKIDIGHKIGHSYFCKFDGDDNPIEFTEKEVQNIFRYEIKPMIEEYFIDDDELLKNALQIVDKWLI